MTALRIVLLLKTANTKLYIAKRIHCVHIITNERYFFAVRNFYCDLLPGLASHQQSRQRKQQKL